VFSLIESEEFLEFASQQGYNISSDNIKKLVASETEWYYIADSLIIYPSFEQISEPSSNYLYGILYTINTTDGNGIRSFFQFTSAGEIKMYSIPD